MEDIYHMLPLIGNVKTKAFSYHTMPCRSKFLIKILLNFTCRRFPISWCTEFIDGRDNQIFCFFRHIPYCQILKDRIEYRVKSNSKIFILLCIPIHPYMYKIYLSLQKIQRTREKKPITSPYISFFVFILMYFQPFFPSIVILKIGFPSMSSD